MRPTYVGIRTYQTDEGPVRVLRREQQVNALAHRETLKRLVSTRRHPQRTLADGQVRRVFLSALAEPGTPAPWDPTVELRPHAEYHEGNTGDTINIVHVPGLGYVPEFEATISGKAALQDVRDGLVEVSLGHVGWFIPAAEIPIDTLVDGKPVRGAVIDRKGDVGVWLNPETGKPEEFDLEMLCDPTDLRVPEAIRPHLGGNHLAVAVPRGRGGPQVRLLLDEVDPSLTLPSPVRAWALRRNIDETGASGTGLVCVLVEREGGLVSSIWTTSHSSAGAYENLETFRQIHIAPHAPGSNELIPLTLGLPLAPSVAPSTQPAPEVAQEITPMADAPNNPPPTPNTAPPATGAAPTADQLAAELNALKQKNVALEQRIAALEAESTKAKQEAAAAEDAKKKAEETAGEAQAKVDELEAELGPFRAAKLEEQRAAGRLVLGLDKDDQSELAKKLGAATSDELPQIVVSGYFEQHPESRPEDLERKLKNPGYCAARFDALHERARQGEPAAGKTSAAFADSLRGSSQPEVKSQQGRKLGSLQALVDEAAQKGVN